MLQDIESFDPLLLEDQLLNILSRSPETSKYLQMRAKEIVQQVVLSSAIQLLRQQVNSLSEQLEWIRQQNHSDHVQFTEQKQKLLSNIAKMKVKVHNYQNQIKQKAGEEKRLLNIEKQNQQLKSNDKQNKKLIIKLTNELKQRQENKQKEDNRQMRCQQQIREIEGRNKKLNESNIQLLQQVQKLKNSQKVSKQSQLEMKKIAETYQNQATKLSALYHKTQTDIRQSIQKRDHERKLMHRKLKNLTTSNKQLTKTVRKIHTISVAMRNTKVAHEELKKTIKMQQQHFQQYVKQKYIEGINQIGSIINKDIEYFRNRTKHMISEIQVHKQQIGKKGQQISHLKKELSEQIQDNTVLKKQLRGRKLQCDTLRDQLKSNYQESHTKLQNLEKNYREILIHENTHY